MEPKLKLHTITTRGDDTCSFCDSHISKGVTAYLVNIKGVNKKDRPNHMERIVCTMRCGEKRMHEIRREFEPTADITPLEFVEQKRQEAIAERNARLAQDKRQRAIDLGESIDREDVFRRDKNTCHICGRKIDRSVCMPHPLAPTIDHKVPVSMGGEHTMRNIGAAHFHCNAVKNARERVPAHEMPELLSFIDREIRRQEARRAARRIPA